MKIDADEKELLESVERGEWKSAGGGKRERTRYSRYAKATFRKDRRLNIRLSSKDLEAIQKRALAEGLPYQTLIASLLHKYRVPVASKRSNQTAGAPRPRPTSRQTHRAEADVQTKTTCQNRSNFRPTAWNTPTARKPKLSWNDSDSPVGQTDAGDCSGADVLALERGGTAPCRGLCHRARPTASGRRVAHWPRPSCILCGSA